MDGITGGKNREMPNYRLLALDIDGTTLTNEKQLTDTNKKWIRRAVDSGVTVIFATGRGFQRVRELCTELQLNDSLVLLNGAEVWKAPGQLWERHFLSPEDVQRLHGMAVETGAAFWGYTIEGFISTQDWTDGMLDWDWMKLGVSHDDLAVVAKLRNCAESWGTLEIAQTETNHLEISPKGITKESGVRGVCSFLGIEMGQVMAIGDDLNDLQLIRAAGLGVAMGNAAEKIKNAADVLTDSNQKNGVAKAIQQYLFELDPEASPSPEFVRK